MLISFGTNELIIIVTVLLPVFLLFLLIRFIIVNATKQKRKIKELEEKVNKLSNTEE